MPDQVQLRGGTSNENDGFTGAEREVTVDTTSHTLRVHDGTTPGGHSLVSGVSSTSSDPGTLIQRDDWGRAQVSEPVNDGDIANRGWVLSQIANLQETVDNMNTPWKDDHTTESSVLSTTSASLVLVREASNGEGYIQPLVSFGRVDTASAAAIDLEIDGVTVINNQQITATASISGSYGYASGLGAFGWLRYRTGYRVRVRTVNAGRIVATVMDVFPEAT